MNDPKAIINAYMDDELTKRQYHELVAWIREAPDNIEHFITECYLHSQLQDIFTGTANSSGCDGVAGCSSRCHRHSHQLLSPAPSFLSTTLHDTSASFLSKGMPLAYLVATVVTGLGILIASHVYVSRPEQVARSSVPAIVAEPASVGRITGMVDCKWNGGSHVSLGQECQLASGLMEITYDTGAKVILQGPVTYEVEANGGYLAVGKLTGKLEKKAEGGRRKAEDAGNQKSPFPLPPSPFVVRTPTATVTDLGTEFGVDVDNRGNCEVNVFHGQVDLVNLASCVTRRLDAKTAPTARVRPGDAHVEMVPQGQTRQHFVRALPSLRNVGDALYPDPEDGEHYEPDTYPGLVCIRVGEPSPVDGRVVRCLCYRDEFFEEGAG